MELIVLIGLCLLAYRLWTGPQKKCPQCGKYVPKDAIACHFCNFAFIRPRLGQTMDEVVREQVEIRKISKRRKNALIGISIAVITFLILASGCTQAQAVTNMYYGNFIASFPDSCYFQSEHVKCINVENEKLGVAAIWHWHTVDYGKKYTQSRQRVMAGDNKWSKAVVLSMKTRMMERLHSVGYHNIENVMAYPIVNKNGVWMTVGLAHFTTKEGVPKSLYKVQIWDDGNLHEMEIVHDNTEMNHEATGNIIHTFMRAR